MNIKKELLRLQEEAILNKEVPIAAIIVRDGIIIGKGYNKIEQNKNILYHAEIVAIQDATDNIETKRLTGSTMYVTHKPCEMCISAISRSEIDKVIYYVDVPNNKMSHEIAFTYNTDLRFERDDQLHNKVREFFLTQR